MNSKQQSDALPIMEFMSRIMNYDCEKLAVGTSTIKETLSINPYWNDHST